MIHYRQEFLGCIRDILDNEEVQRLDNVPHHLKYTRLRHSINVAYLSFCIAKILGWDASSTARGGMLHDFFFQEDSENPHVLMFTHPQVALIHARQICTLNAVEEDIILRHMWGLTANPPKFKEGYLVSFVDKACCLQELASSLLPRKKNIYSAVRMLSKLTPS